MKKNSRKVTSLLLSVIIIITLLPMNVFATGEEVTVEKIEVVDAPELYENIDGAYTTEMYNSAIGENETVEEYFKYNTYSLTNKMLIKVTYSDGSDLYGKGSIKDDALGGGSFSYEINQGKDGEIWTKGGTNTITVTYKDVECAYDVKIVENPISSVEIIDAQPVYEYVDGYFVDDDRTEFRYYYGTGNVNDYTKNFNVKVTFTDGSVKYSNYTTLINNYPDGVLTLGINDNQSEKMWTKGATDNNATVSLYGKSDTCNVEVLENPVDSIEVISGEAGVLAEETEGNWYNRYPEGSTTAVKYFAYDMPDFSDVKIRINYKDGTNYIGKIYDEVNGYQIIPNPSQYDEPWVVGSDNQLAIEYMGKTCNLPITVEESPIERIELASAPTKEYIYGDWTYGRGIGGALERYESFTPSDLTGLEFTVYYKDGTQKTVTDADIDYENREIDGKPFLVETIASADVGTHTITFTYMDCSFEYDVTIVESTVEKIEFIYLPERTDFEPCFTNDFLNTKIKITYTDGTVKETYLDGNKIIYGTDTKFKYNDVQGYISDDNGYYYVYYLGAFAYDQSKNLNHIPGMPSDDIVDVKVTDFVAEGNGALLVVDYTDGTRKEYPLDIDYDSSTTYENVCEGCYSNDRYAFTDEGLLHYVINTYYAEDGTVDHYIVDILNREILIDPNKWTPISTKEELAAMADDMRGKYYLTNDIIFTDADFEEGGAFYNDGKGWIPIGTEDRFFNGKFDGRGYTIQNLTINIDGDPEPLVAPLYLGLFGYAKSSEFKNVGMIDTNISADVDKATVCAGAICGSTSISNAGIIENCYNTGDIIVTAASNDLAGKVGGLFGTVTGNDDIEFSNCYNTGDITGNYDVGGIAGHASRFNVKNCYNAGNISGGNYVGGIVGENMTVMRNCYNVGTVVSEGKAGGIVGHNLCSSSSLKGDVADCYYLDVNTYAAGKTDWLTETVYASTKATKCTDEQMKNQATFETFDFDAVWTMAGSEEYLYPELRMGADATEDNIVLDEDSDYVIDSQVDYITNIQPTTTVETLKSNLQNDETSIQVVDKSGAVVERDYLATGDKVQLVDGTTVIDEKIVVVLGDTSGDGKVRAGDATKVLNQIVDGGALVGAYLAAADASGDGKVRAGDATKILNYIVDGVALG